MFLISLDVRFMLKLSRLQDINVNQEVTNCKNDIFHVCFVSCEGVNINVTSPSSPEFVTSFGSVSAPFLLSLAHVNVACPIMFSKSCSFTSSALFIKRPSKKFNKYV